MATDAPRLRFLQAAAHLLAVPSPTISATLGAAHDKVLESQDADAKSHTKEWDLTRRGFCGACGNVMVPSWSCKVSQEIRPTTIAEGAKKDTLKCYSDRKAKEMVYLCLRCNRKTVQPLQPRTARHSEATSLGLTSVKPISEANESTLQGTNRVVKSANLSSKQRAKSRKGGLQAMLAQSKTQGSTSKGLDLMDFMQ